MCGIAGFNLADSESIDARALSTALLHEIVARGRDATGVAYVEGNRIKVTKRAVNAYRFTRHLNAMPTTTRNVILHTRFATQGSPQVNANNHPIIVPGLVGVHNGHLSNDDAVFQHLSVERRGQVDSEAAFALLAATSHHPTEVLGVLQGRAALAWIDTRDRHALHLARVDGSPLAIGQTAAGSLIFASTARHLLAACDVAGITLDWYDQMQEGVYLKARHGRINEYMGIEDPIKQVA